ncbi:MAG: alpha-L-rhamnosidase [Kiritimatiellae bacterium]|nr:alpha-L-rhamnosidase [Kiritimatiellia bacterium]
MKLVSLLAIGMMAAAAIAGTEEKVDPRVRTYISPSRVVWQSENSEKASVSNSEILCRPRLGQVPEGAFLNGSGCTLENKGERAGVLVDFGRELHGGLLIASGGPSSRGVKVRVRFGESVAEAMSELGERGACNDHAIRDSEIDLPWAGTREIGNTGFRFVRIDLLTKGRLQIEYLKAVSLMRPMQYLGGFKCSDDRLNEVWATAARTVHLCCQDYLWDGIKRDRLVWMGDSHPEMMSILAVFGAQSILPESFDYMRATTSPNAWMDSMPSYTLWWLRCVYEWYHYTGDLDYLKKHREYIKATCKHVLQHIGADNKCTMGGFLDWPSNHNKPAVASGMQALMLEAMVCSSKMAEALNDAEFKKECDNAVSRLASVKPAPHGSKQAAALLALAGLRDEREMYDQVLGKDGVKNVSTFYGYYMLEAMSKVGENQCAVNTVRDYWGGMLDMGATSFWEDFNIAWTNNAFRIDQLPVAGKKDIHGDYGEFCYVGFRHSLCHGWSSGPAAWLIHHVLGITAVETGCKTVRVKPFLGDLEWAEGSFPLPTGEVVKVRVDKTPDGQLKTDVKAPDWVKIIR